MSNLVHIVPQLPPAIDGVGDYCWNLWKHWPEQQPDWKFLVTRGAEETSSIFPGAKVRNFERNAASLIEALEKSKCQTAVLHYVGYAYQPKGIPVWLPRALGTWRRPPGRPEAGREVIVIFHEMYARSSPLRSPFWVAPLARRIIRELVGMADVWVTSCERYFGQLVVEFEAQGTAGRIIPIPSNIPALPGLDISPSSGKLRIALFGLARTRTWALERHWKLLRALHRAGLVEHVTLVGKRPTAQEDREWRHLAEQVGSDLRWRTRFDLLVEEISRELAAHDIGLLANEPDILTKSGVFAALAAHGVVPIVSTPSRQQLPERWRSSLLANDDNQEIEKLLHLLRGTEALRQRREGLRAIASRELGWSGVATSWAELIGLNRPAVARVQPHASPLSPGNGTAMEVPA